MKIKISLLSLIFFSVSYGVTLINYSGNPVMFHISCWDEYNYNPQHLQPTKINNNQKAVVDLSGYATCMSKNSDVQLFIYNDIAGYQKGEYLSLTLNPLEDNCYQIFSFQPGTFKVQPCPQVAPSGSC